MFNTSFSAHHGPTLRRNPYAHPFMFATGIENSYPVITGKHGQDVRVDEMECTGHYQHWREDLGLVQELGIGYLRWGPPYYKVHQGPGRFDWAFTDEVLHEMRTRKIVVILDLCHFGVPDWVGSFQNPDWPTLFADYSTAVAKRYPWVQFYTPVNEINVAAKFSALYGWWNERLASDRAYITALKHLCRANVLAEEAIVRQQRHALFVQSESTEYFHATVPEAIGRAAFLNQLRFLGLDLIYGVDVAATTYEYLLDNGLTRDEYHWFIDHASDLKPYCIMGNDYYDTNEHLVVSPDPDIAIEPAGRMFGYYIITHQYFDRYHLPVMHTETNQRDEEDSVGWLHEQWNNLVRLKMDGLPILGFTWYSLTDQMDWDTALRENNHHVNPLGLFDLHRKIRKVGTAYQELINRWRDILPMESRGLSTHRGELRPVGFPDPTPGPPRFDKRGLNHGDKPDPAPTGSRKNKAKAPPARTRPSPGRTRGR